MTGPVLPYFRSQCPAAGGRASPGSRVACAIRRFLGWVALLSLFLPPTLEAAARPFNVLVVFAESRLTHGMIEVDEGVRSAIDAAFPRAVRYYNEFLELGQFEGNDYEARLVEFLQSKYARHRIDLVVTVLGGAARFLARHRDQLFPDATLVFCVIEQREWEDIRPVRNATAVLADFDIAGTIDAILALQPQTERIVTVIGASPWEQFWELQSRRVFEAYLGRIEFEYLVGLPLPQIKERVGVLPADTVVLYEILLRDREGGGYVPEEAAEEIAAAASVPVYGLAEPFLGRGIVGGKLVSLREQGRLAGELAVRVLNGEDPTRIAPVRSPTTRPLFDWQQLQRWGLSKARLPAGVELRYRKPSIWEEHRWPILGAASLVLLQTVLISALLIQRRVRLRAEAELRESERRMSVAAKAARLGLWVWNIPRNDFWITPDGRALYGDTDSGRLDFERFMDAVYPDDRTPTRAAIQSALEGKGDYETEYRVALPDGQVRWIAARGRVEFDGAGRPALMRGVSIDVTARKQAELDAERHRSELAHLNRVGMLGQLSASFAHELIQPLTAILSNAQAALRFLKSEVVERDELREILRDIVADDQRAGQVIERLRALFKRGEPNRRALDINEVVRDVLRLLRSDLVTRSIAVSTDLDPTLPPISGDPVQVQQVLLNLIINGCDAMVDNAPGDRRLSVCTGLIDGEGVAVSVSDRGRGIPADQIRKIFEPFVTTKAQGTGLGLSISRSIVLDHGGKLSAANNPGRGATFTVVLPARAGAAA